MTTHPVSPLERRTVTPLAIGRVPIGTLLGYLAMALGITLVQEVLFGGVTWVGSSTMVLLVAGTGTFLCGVGGGALASRVAGVRGSLAVASMIVLVGVETTWLIRTGRATDPLWFDLLASASLMAGIGLGGWIQRRGPGVSAAVVRD